MPSMARRGAMKVIAIISATIVVLAMLLVSSGALRVASQTVGDVSWETLAGDPYRRSFVPTTIGTANIAGNRLWRYDPAGDGLGYFPVNVNPLIVDVNNDGSSEIVAVNSGGVLIILDSTGGLLASYVINGEPHSTPAAANLDNDPGGDLEIVVGTKDGRVVAIDALGPSTYYWKSPRLDERISTSPLVVDLDGDGLYEVVVQTRSGLVCLDGTTGQILWRSTAEDMVMVQSPALLGDINNDNVMDVVGSGFKGIVYAASGANGAILWETDLWTADASLDGLFIVHTPVVADVDGDGSLEVIVSMGREVFGKMYIGGTQYVTRTGFLGALVILDSATGRIEGIVSPQGQALYAWFAQPAIAVGDIDGDNINEVIVACADGNIVMVDYTGGGYTSQPLFQYDTYWVDPNNGGTSPAAASLVIVNLDNDATYEVLVFATSDSGGNLLYRVYKYDYDAGASTVLYSSPQARDINYARPSWPSISIGDLDGDGDLEAVVTVFRYIEAIG